MRIYLIRHAETDHNRDGMIQGRADPALNERGLWQAAALERHFSKIPLDAIYSSPLRRALQTAAAIAESHGLAVEPAPALIEMDVGELDGLSRAEAHERYADLFRGWRAGPNPALPLPGGESLEAVQARSWHFVESFREQAGIETIACVTHHFVALAVLCRALNLPMERINHLRQDVASFSAIEFRGDRIQVMKLNQICDPIDP